MIDPTTPEAAERAQVTDAMINAAAEAICERRNTLDWPCNGLDFDVELAKAALRAPLAAQELSLIHI